MGFHPPLIFKSDASRRLNIGVHTVMGEQELDDVDFGTKRNAPHGYLVCDGIGTMILQVLSDGHDHRIQVSELRRVVYDCKRAG